MKARIAVWVLADGQWAAAGGTMGAGESACDEDAVRLCREALDYEDEQAARWFWVEVDIEPPEPLPPPQTVEAKAEPAESRS